MLTQLLDRRDSIAGTLGSAVSASSASQDPSGQLPTELSGGRKLISSGRARQASAMLACFRSMAPELLIPATSDLRYPTMAISLPGTAYPNTLWDWDTRFTCQALFGICRTLKNEALNGGFWPTLAEACSAFSIISPRRGESRS